MKTYETTVYNYQDMLKAKEMTNEEARSWIEILDRGYFNQYTYFDENDEFKEYTEDQYAVFCMNIAIDKALKLLSSK